MSVLNMISASLRLLRFPNLLVVALTQMLVYYWVIRPALETANIPGVLTEWKFFELCAVTLAITASGYLINDLQDIKADEINRPKKKTISTLGKDVVVWFYAMTLLVGFLVSQLLAYRLEERALLWIFPMAIGALAVYSIGLKRVPALGNLMVAAYCAGVPGILLLAERRGLKELLLTNERLAKNTVNIVLLFMLFAFLATLLRELIKDIEDVRGDREIGRRTLPVMLGENTSKHLSILMGLVVIASIMSPIFFRWTAFLSPALHACIISLSVAMVIILIMTYRAREQADYGRISLVLKLFLMAGLGLLIFF